jgi:acyl-CoA thioesterase-1
MKFFLLFILFVSAPLYAKTVIIIGDSLTEGFGVKSEEAYPAQLEALFHANGRTDIKVINGGVSGSTTANAVSRTKWYLKKKPEVIVFALGANDGLRGLAIEESEKNLSQAITLAQKNAVKVFLALMKLPKNYGEEYRSRFEKMYENLLRQKNVGKVNFILEGVGGVAALNLADGIHPNPQGQKKVAENIFQSLKDQL